MTRISAVGKPTEPCRNLTAEIAKGRLLRSSEGKDRERPTEEPVEAGTKRNKDVARGSITSPKPRIGCVRRTRGSKERHTVALDVTGEPSKTCTEALQPESRLLTTSELRASCRTLDREEQQQEDTAALWGDRTVRSETAYIISSMDTTNNWDAE